jgi:hypothetical protein
MRIDFGCTLKSAASQGVCDWAKPLYATYNNRIRRAGVVKKGIVIHDHLHFIPRIGLSSAIRLKDLTTKLFTRRRNIVSRRTPSLRGKPVMYGAHGSNVGVALQQGGARDTCGHSETTTDLHHASSFGSSAAEMLFIVMSWLSWCPITFSKHFGWQRYGQFRRGTSHEEEHEPEAHLRAGTQPPLLSSFPVEPDWKEITSNGWCSRHSLRCAAGVGG